MKPIAKRLYCLIISLLLLTAAAEPTHARSWEAAKTERTDARRVAKEADVEVKAARGIVIVTANKPVKIEIFTILGQLVSSDTLPAGTSQMQITAHGIYIVKIGELTVKVAL